MYYFDGIYDIIIIKINDNKKLSVGIKDEISNSIKCKSRQRY